MTYHSHTPSDTTPTLFPETVAHEPPKPEPSSVSVPPRTPKLEREIRDLLRHDCAVLVDRTCEPRRWQVIPARTHLMADAIELGGRVRPLASEWDADWHWLRPLSLTPNVSERTACFTSIGEDRMMKDGLPREANNVESGNLAQVHGKRESELTMQQLEQGSSIAQRGSEEP